MTAGWSPIDVFFAVVAVALVVSVAAVAVRVKP